MGNSFSMHTWQENRKKAIFYFSFVFSVSLSQSSVDTIGKLKAIGKITLFAISQGWLRSQIDQTLLSWFRSTRLIFSYLHHTIMNFQKIWKSHFRVLPTQQQCSKFQNFRLCTKKVIETQKCTQAATPLLFRQFLT